MMPIEPGIKAGFDILHYTIWHDLDGYSCPIFISLFLLLSLMPVMASGQSLKMCNYRTVNLYMITKSLLMFF